MQLHVCCHLSYRANEKGERESLFVRASGESETLLRTTLLCSVSSSVRLLEGVTNRASVLSEEVKEHLETLSS